MRAQIDDWFQRIGSDQEPGGDENDVLRDELAFGGEQEDVTVQEEQFGRKSKLTDSASKKKRVEKFSVDSMAAAIILRDYLKRRTATSEGPAE